MKQNFNIGELVNLFIPDRDEGETYLAKVIGYKPDGYLNRQHGSPRYKLEIIVTGETAFSGEVRMKKIK